MRSYYFYWFDRFLSKMWDIEKNDEKTICLNRSLGGVKTKTCDYLSMINDLATGYRMMSTRKKRNLNECLLTLEKCRITIACLFFNVHTNHIVHPISFIRFFIKWISDIFKRFRIYHRFFIYLWCVSSRLFMLSLIRLTRLNLLT